MSQEYLYLTMLFLLMIITGIWLRQRGKPYCILIQTIHKLIGAGGAFYSGYLIFPILLEFSASAGLWALAIISFTLFLVLIATGGLLATEKQMPAAVLLVHKVFPYLAVILNGITAYLVF